MAFFPSESHLLELLWFAFQLSVLVIALNLVVGYGGLFQLGHVGFFAVGAMTSTFATHPDYLGLDFVSGAIIGIAASVLVAFLLGSATLRLAGDYFAIASLGFAVIVQVTLTAFYPTTVPNVPPITFFGTPLPTEGNLFGYELGYRHYELALAGLFTLAVYLIASRIVHSPFGRVLRGQKEDEIAARSLGKNTQGYRLSALLASAAIASLAGSLYIHHVTVFDPVAFNFGFMVTLLVIVILGGLGSTLGSVVGTFVYVALDFLALRLATAADEASALDVDWSALRIMLFSALIVLLMIYRPRGLLGGRDIPAREAVRSLAGRIRRWRRGAA